MKVEFEIINYKKIRKMNGELQSGNLYFIQGGNEKGKTSFIQAILSLLEGKTKNKQKITHGAKDGKVQAKFEGADGETYVIRIDMKQNGDKFTIIKPDMTVSNKRTDLATIFGYNSFTVDDWFGWGLTAEGRKKQAEIIKSIMPESAIKELNEINIDVDTKNGLLFLERQDIGRDIKRLKGALESTEKPTEVKDKETALQAIRKWENQQVEIAEEIKKVEIKKANHNSLIEQEQMSRKAIDDKRLLIENTNANYDNNVQDVEEKIILLQDELEKAKERLKSLDKEHEIYEKQSTEELEAMEKAHNEKYKNLLNDAHEDVNAKINNLKENNEKLLAAIQKMNGIINQFDQLTAKEAELIELETRYEDLDTAITEKRARAKEIMSDTSLPINNVGIDESGEAYFIDSDGSQLPFTEENISYSAGGIAVLKIMTYVNKKLPIWLIGNISEYDDAKKALMAKLAEQYDGIIIGDRVLEDNAKELELVVYDKSQDNETSINQKELF